MGSVAADGHAAIDDDFRAGDEARLIGGEEQDRGRRIAAVAHEAQRDSRMPSRACSASRGRLDRSWYEG